MSSRKVHEQDCIKRLGAPFTHVHKFLDQYAKYYGTREHRKILHNRKGLDIIRRRWGERAYRAGKIHIWRDRRS